MASFEDDEFSKSDSYVHAIINIVMAVCKQKALIAKIEDITVPMILRSLKPEG